MDEKPRSRTFYYVDWESEGEALTITILASPGLDNDTVIRHAFCVMLNAQRQMMLHPEHFEVTRPPQPYPSP